MKNHSKTEIADFRFNPAIQNRPAQILNIEKEENGIVLTLGTIARRAMLSYTHETSLHLYKPADITAPKVYLHIELWTDEIFRIVFSKDKEIINHFVGLPEDAQMLIAKPENVYFTFYETVNEITLTTAKIVVTINKETTKISAKFIDGKEFYSQKKQDFRTGDIHDLALADLDGDYGYLSKDKDGKPYQLPDTCQGSWVKDVTIDFSNPDACKWYADKIAELIKLGAAAIKTDFGEGIAEDAIYQNIDA